MPAALITESRINIVMDDGQIINIAKGEPFFSEIRELAKERKWDEIQELSSKKKIISVFSNGNITITDDMTLLYRESVEIDGLLAKRVISMFNEGFDLVPMCRFMENLMLNPSENSKKELYNFLEKGNHPITEDGYFLAYKVVGNDYYDKYSHIFLNTVGENIQMNRADVNSDSSVTCSTGLHVCSRSYISAYRDVVSDHVMVVKVNPRDVVSVPKDYNDAKMRCCEYTVIGELVGDDHIEGLVTKDVKKKTITNLKAPKKKDIDNKVIDELYDSAVALAINNGRVSGKMLRKAFNIGDKRAARLVSQLLNNGIVDVSFKVVITAKQNLNKLIEWHEDNLDDDWDDDFE